MEKNQMRQRVVARLTELGIGAVEAAERVPGLERNYIRDFVQGKKESFSHAKISLVAQALDWTLAQLEGEPENAPPVHDERIVPFVRNPTLQTFPQTELIGRIDLPVYSTANGGRGALVLSNEPYTSIARPQNLLGIRESYGVLIKGNSMAREYNENDIAYVDPVRHPKKDDPCVFQSRAIDGTVTAIIKYLDRSPDAHDTLYYVYQTNPLKKFTLKKAEWQKCNVLVGKIAGPG